MGRRAVPVWALLVVLTLVPTLGMGFFAAREAGESADAARRAAEVERDTTQLAALMELVFALQQEALPSQALASARLYGITDQQAAELLGFDLRERRDRSRVLSDDAVDGLPAGTLEGLPGLHDVEDRLRRARGLVDDPETDPTAIQAAYVDLITRGQLATAAKLRNLAGPDGGAMTTEVRVALAAFSSVVDIQTSAQVEIVALYETLFRPGDPTSAQQLLVAHASFAEHAERLDEQTEPRVAALWRTIRSSDPLEEVATAVDRVAADATHLSDAGLGAAAEVFVAGIERSDLFAELVRTAGQASVEAAGVAEQDARHAHRETIIVSAGVGILALYLAFMLAWIISQPLHRLARRALAVSRGHLTDEALGATGPREVRVVGQALDEAGRNLRRVEQQALALAAGELDDEVLHQPAPGVLGASLHASVEQLSSSLRAQEELRERLAEQASHDMLTGLLNRAGCLAAADQALARAARTGRQIALLFLDLDGFKRANDNHGHSTGDTVLRITGERLVAAARAGDTIARLGGDEFVVVAEPIDDIEQAVALAERLVAAVSEPIVVDGRTARVGASIGVAVNQDAHESGTDLLRDADQAVYRAKRAGRGRVEVFDESLRRELAERAEIEEALRHGLDAGELALHYQPVVDTVTGALQGFEALARWDRPGHGNVPPVVFVPVAESCDLVVDLGRWVLAEATSQLVAWSDDHVLAGCHVSVNISGRHLLNTSIVDDVRGALARSGLEASRLVLEITETVILSDLDIVVRHLVALRRLGVRVALDDFGTGYTSIGQLGQLPIDVLKIDRAFVSELDREGDRSIVELMVEVAHTLGLGLVAEGVEDREQLHALQHLACDDVQGYLIARPLPPERVREWAAALPSEPAPARP